MATVEEMDKAAVNATHELLELVPEECIMKVAQWWRRNYLLAGHKRLGRILVAIAKQTPSTI
jgi:hypothetical protein